MDKNLSFEDIRPYNDSEVTQVLNSLLEKESFIKVLEQVFANKDITSVKNSLLQIKSIKEFQSNFIQNLALDITNKTSSNLSIEGLEKINHRGLFISNHRDIILDSMLLNVLLLKNNKETSNIAIGNNLFVADWIEPLVRINKNIVVKRNIPIRQMLEASQNLSAYIRLLITQNNEFVWIAQREGRAKDSNDRTQESLIKMLNMSGNKSFVQNIQELHVIPTSISYEYDPCDYLKAKEFQQKRDNPEHKKTAKDDAINMLTGLQEWKGKIHYKISLLNSQDFEKTSTKKDRNEQLACLTQIIDKKIHQGYLLFNTHKIAHDLFLKKNTFEKEYSTEEKTTFQAYVNKQVNRIDLPNKDSSFLEHKLLEMYANPAINFLSANETN